MVQYRTAAEAALARIQGQKKDTVHFNTSLAAIRAQVQRELEVERKAKSDVEKCSSSQEQMHTPKVLTDEHNRNLAAQGVYFRYAQSQFIKLFVIICIYLFDQLICYVAIS